MEGHPAVDWLTGANPLGQMTLTSVWNFPDELQPLGKRDLVLPARMAPATQPQRRRPGSAGGSPRGWKSVGNQPPSEITLNGVYKGDWEVKKNNS